MTARTSGVLLHITSLPSSYGIGDLGPHAYSFADFLKASGQKYWQILPINPTDGINGHSPYSCYSAFAGNPLFISPDLMVMEGFLKATDLRQVPDFDTNQVDFNKVIIFKEKLFDIAFKKFMNEPYKGGYELFISQHKHWLDDFAVFVVAKTAFKGQSWNQWPKGLKNRQPKALALFVKKNAQDIERIKFIQYLFYRQWNKWKSYVNDQGLAIIGDIPIYVNYDSVDVWRHPSFYKLDNEGEPRFISGCPPDYFSKTGQRWGNPVYDWTKLKRAKYSWWVSRIAHNLSLVDVLRIDHFRGFSSFWQIPAHEKLAVFGQWVKGPGEDFFKTLTKRFDKLPLIAEDLGEPSDDMNALMKKFDLPGMRVLLFAFGGDPRKNPHAPLNYPVNSVVYTGTHDNNTVQGWYYDEAKEYERANIKTVLGLKPQPKQLHWQMIQALMKSKAQAVIIPMADILGLGSKARMNTPATKVNNWKWFFESRDLNAALVGKLLKLTRQYKRN